MKNTEQLSAQRPSTLPHSPSTPCHKPARFLPLALLLAALAIPGSQAQATIRFWNGGGANNYWTTAANWGGTAPVAGDDLIFQANSAVDVTSLNNTNNFAAGTAFRSITFQVLSTNYVLNGNQVVFSDAAVTALSSQSSGQNAVNFDIQLNVNQTFEATLAYGPLVIDGAVNLNGHHLTNSVVNTSGNINIGGRISGTGDLVKTGNGTLLLDGAVNNTYSGTTRVTDGTLELNDVSAATEMVPGDVIISAGATLLLSEGNQIADNANITVNGTAGLISSSGRLNLNGYSDIISALTLSGGGDVATGAGTLTLGGNLTASAAYDLFSGNYNQASISGNLSLGSATRTFSVANNTSVSIELNISANISGSGTAGITKTGTGTMALGGANTYPGLTTVSSGLISAGSASPFGNSTAGTVLSGGSVILEGVTVANEWLTNNSASSILEGGDALTSGWSSNIVLNADLDVYVFTNGTLDLAGAIRGTGGIIKSQPGTLVFSGATANEYAGVTIVNEGQLDLNKTISAGAVPAGLVIGDGTGTDTVRCLRALQIWSLSSFVTIHSSGVFDLNGFEDTAIPLTLDGGQITTGSGLVWLGGTVTVLPGVAPAASINGNAYLYASVVITNAGHSLSPDLNINAAISGDTGRGITKTGAGEVALYGANTFSGPVTVDAGMLTFWNSSALGNITTPATVNSGGTLHVAGNLTIGNKPLVLNGPGWGVSPFLGALAASDGVSSWAGPITNASDSIIYVYSSRSLELSGPISGPGNLTKTGAGTNIFSGTTANTYAGTTRVNEGTLVLSKTSSVKSVPGNLVIGNGSGSDVVRLGSNNQIATTADVFIQSGGLLECGVYYALIDTLRGTGTVSFGTLGFLGVGENNGSSTFDGPLTGIGYAAGYTLGKNGSGTFTMNGNASFSAGITHVYAGKLVANGSISSAITVDAGATLGGTGTVGALTDYGVVSPGASAGRLNSGNLTFGASSSLAIELNGATVGSGYDQLNAVGTVNLTGAALSPLTVGFPLTEGTQFIIVNNDGGDVVTGTFDGLAEGAVVSDSTGKFSFRLSYIGGSGNDTVLTMTNLSLTAGAAVVWSGNGNAAIEANECNLLSLAVNNISASAMSGVTATLQSLTPGVAVVQPFSSYPNIPASGTRTNDSFFQVTTQPGFICGTTVDLELEVATATHGILKVPFSLPSGVAGSVVRYNNNVDTAIPDGGFVDKTFVVSGITTPLKKVAVSLHITHTADSDLDISLIAPDGTTVNLSSDNGGTSDDYGTDCIDAFRTTFDSTAATAITAGTPPYVGTFRPEASLTVFNEKSGTNVNGTWTLRIADDAAGAVGSIRCCSLLLYPTACTPGSGICELCPDVTIKSYTGPATPLQSGYLLANEIPSSCGSMKTCPSASGASFPAESFTFRNGPADACITVTVAHQNASGSLVAAAYLGSFDPAGDKCINYLADAGYFINASHPSQSFSFNVSSNAVFVVNILTDAGGMPYTLAVSGGNCRPVLNVTRTGASNLELDWTTAAPGYQLEGANRLNGVPWVGIPPNAPVVVGSKFTVTNAMSTTNYFFRLRKP